MDYPLKKFDDHTTLQEFVRWVNHQYPSINPARPAAYMRDGNAVLSTEPTHDRDLIDEGGMLRNVVCKVIDDSGVWNGDRNWIHPRIVNAMNQLGFSYVWQGSTAEIVIFKKDEE